MTPVTVHCTDTVCAYSECTESGTSHSLLCRGDTAPRPNGAHAQPEGVCPTSCCEEGCCAEQGAEAGMEARSRAQGRARRHGAGHGGTEQGTAPLRSPQMALQAPSLAARTEGRSRQSKASRKWDQGSYFHRWPDLSQEGVAAPRHRDTPRFPHGQTTAPRAETESERQTGSSLNTLQPVGPETEPERPRARGAAPQD